MRSFSLETRSWNQRVVLRLSLRRVLAVLAVTVYPVLLLWALRDVVSPTYSYMGFSYTPPASTMVTAVALLAAVMPGLAIPISNLRPSTIVIWTLYVLAYVPAQIVPVYASDRAFSSYVPFQMALLSGIVILLLFGSLPVFAIPALRVPPLVFWAGLFAMSCLVYAGVIVRYGVPTNLPGLGDVYNVRSEFGAQSAGQGHLLAYGMSWQSKVVNPLFMAYGIVKRSVWFLALGFAGQLLLFALAGHKSVLFSVFLVLGILFIVRRRGVIAGALFPIGASGLVLTSVWLDKILETNWLTSLFVRRLILVPGLLTGYYHEFFTTNPKTNSFGPFLGWAFDTPYSLRVPNIIGLQYFNNATMSANANLWADGFASFGYIGVVLFSVVLGLILWTFNTLGRHGDARIATVLAGVASFSLVNSSLMTSIGTHGIGFALILLALLPPGAPMLGRRNILAFPGRAGRIDATNDG